MHDLNETNPGPTLFSAELPWCCFCLEIKVLGMERNFARIFISNKRISGAKTYRRGHLGGHNPPGRAPSAGAPRWVVPTWCPADPETNAIKSYFRRTKSGRKIITIHETELPPSPVLPREGRSGVRLGLRRGGSLFFVITNPSPSPIP